jgi:hypothetical protein
MYYLRWPGISNENASHCFFSGSGSKMNLEEVNMQFTLEMHLHGMRRYYKTAIHWRKWFSRLVLIIISEIKVEIRP